VPVLPETLTLHGSDVVLRDWRDDDAASVEPVCGDPEVCRFTTVPWTYSRSAAVAWISRLHARRLAGSGLALAITRSGADTALGNVNLVRFSADGQTAALGYWVIPAARRRGLALAGASLLCDWGFAELHLSSIELAILPENTASHRVAERLGAVRQGLRRNSHQAEGRLWDMVIYKLTPTD